MADANAGAAWPDGNDADVGRRTRPDPDRSRSSDGVGRRRPDSGFNPAFVTADASPIATTPGPAARTRANVQ
jgi:hypothetical protein